MKDEYKNVNIVITATFGISDVFTTKLVSDYLYVETKKFFYSYFSLTKVSRCCSDCIGDSSTRKLY